MSLPAGCTACREDIGADGLGVSLITRGEIRTVAYATDPRSYQLEDAQLVAGQGPCTEAYLRRRVVETDLHPAAEQWPFFARTAAELGIRSVTAVPLLVGDDVPIGAMDIYRTTTSPLTTADRTRLEAYSRVLALLALDAHPALIGWDQASPETAPIGYPPLVHQAAGAAAEASGVSVEDALARMRAHAFSNQRLLLDIARDILAGRLRLEEDRDTP
ncbi:MULTISPECIES: GAF domain-containing protein [Streptomyces]|uniref:GAF domain-containing protein n=1 Tax=Streptomyces xanthochromogenes TaxID=67384 RepID=A0ABQ3AP61_9ACTN|nr:GAF domain-containing protein [Streptomyces xanthochromogenes]MYV90125.1 GAF domain-containing protein [Streptomyces sp. SID1034]GGY61147.1 GAF domain-containing protein [Streptomyces xanthochromogenes]